MKVFETLSYIQKELSQISDNPVYESYAFLSHVLSIPKEKIMLEGGKEIPKDVEEKVSNFISKRKKKYPYFYITGKRWFYGIEFFISEDVLIPRPETEILVEEIIKTTSDNLNILDIGSGSGCILLSLLYHKKKSTGIGIDVSSGAIEIATKNAQRLELESRSRFLCADIQEYESDLLFDVVVSNPPYVKTENVSRLLYEPKVALDGGVDGMKYYPIIAKKAFSFLKPGGLIVLEIDDDLKNKVENTLLEQGFKDIYSLKDYSNFWRCTFGKKK